jgi:olefin beta-lactone synthetase
VNVIELFGNSLQTAADKPALISGLGKARRVVSFAGLASRIDRLAQECSVSGLQPGDRVLLAVPLSIEMYVAMMAILKAGCVVMVIDPAHGAAEVARCLRAFPPAGIVASRAMLLLRFVSPEMRRIPVRLVVAPGPAGSPRLAEPVVPRSPEDSALLTFTSGSTGEPKAVVRKHGLLRAQLDMLNRVACPEATDVDLAAMPMFALFNLANGITTVIPACDTKRPGKADPRALLAQLRQEKVTTMVASPTLLERLAGHCLRTRQAVPTMRCISTGGGPVSPKLLQQLPAIAVHSSARCVYGSTEAEPIASLCSREISLADKQAMQVGAGLLVGRPVDGCEARIIPNCCGSPLGPFSDAGFAALALPPGQIGEIVVSGRHVLTGYADPFRNRETKIDAGRKRWHRSGDAGYFDDHGRLWLVGRCDAVIRDSRGTIYPFQVEFAVNAVKGIRRAALLSEQGQRVLVLQTAGADFGGDCLKAARCIADKQIDRIVTVRHIPLDRRHDAKIDYPALRRSLDGPCIRLRLTAMSRLARVCRLYRTFRAKLCLLGMAGRQLHSRRKSP